MQVYWMWLLCQRIGPEKSHIYAKPGGFIDLKRGVKTCQPGVGDVPKCGQKLGPWEGT